MNKLDNHMMASLPADHVETRTPLPCSYGTQKLSILIVLLKTQTALTGASTAELDSSFKPLHLCSGANVLAW